MGNKFPPVEGRATSLLPDHTRSLLTPSLGQSLSSDQARLHYPGSPIVEATTPPMGKRKERAKAPAVPEGNVDDHVDSEGYQADTNFQERTTKTHKRGRNVESCDYSSVQPVNDKKFLWPRISGASKSAALAAPVTITAKRIADNGLSSPDTLKSTPKAVRAIQTILSSSGDEDDDEDDDNARPKKVLKINARAAPLIKAASSITKDQAFPSYPDGDVSIVLSAAATYRLHSVTLKRAIPAFVDLLTAENAKHLTRAMIQEGFTVKWFVYLVDSQEFAEDKQFIVNNSKMKPASLPISLLDHLPRGKGDMNASDRKYDNFFRALYTVPLALSGGIAAILSDLYQLVELAESFKAVHIVVQSVELELLRHHQAIYESIAANCVGWADLGFRIKSGKIFREAVVHIVGQWGSIKETAAVNMKKEIRDLVERKFSEANMIKDAVDIRILGHYKASMLKSLDQEIGRGEYGKDIYDWMCVCLFRHWFAQEIVEGRGRQSEDGGCALYRRIEAGGSAYLGRDSLIDFHTYFPMTNKGKACLWGHLQMFKYEIAKWVEVVLHDNTMLDEAHKPLPYLTFTNVEKSDLPWYVLEVESEAPGELTEDAREDWREISKSKSRRDMDDDDDDDDDEYEP